MECKEVCISGMDLRSGANVDEYYRGKVTFRVFLSFLFFNA